MTVIVPAFSYAALVKNLDALMGKAWLMTNGLEGYVSSPLREVAIRRYHEWFAPGLVS